MVGASLSVVTSNVNRLYFPVRRQRLAEWYKHMIQLYILSTGDLDSKTQIDWKWNGGKRCKCKRADILISDKIHFKSKKNYNG